MSRAELHDESQHFLAHHARRNYWLYLLVVVSNLSASAFGDMTAFVPSLAMRLGAPSWLVVFPMVAGLSIAYAPALIVAWLMGPHASRVRAYAISVALMYVPILVLALFLFRGGSDQLLVVVLVASIVAYSLAMGVTILPCWDLFTRIFPDDERPKMVAHAGAAGQIALLLSAPVAAWLISEHSPLPYPKNYAAAMLIFSADGLLGACIILMMREYRPPVPPGHDRRLSTFLRSLRDILRNDRRFVMTLKVAAVAYITAAVFSLILNHAQKFRGFSATHDVPLLIAVKPFVAIPAALFFAYLARRLGPARVGALLALLTAVAMPFAMVLPGRWQFLPLLLVLLGSGVSVYAMLTVMRYAKPALMHQYLALYFTACMIPGLAPLGLAWVLDRSPVTALTLILFASLAGGIGFLFADRRGRASAAVGDAPAPAEAAPAGEGALASAGSAGP